MKYMKRDVFGKIGYICTFAMYIQNYNITNVIRI